MEEILKLEIDFYQKLKKINMKPSKLIIVTELFYPDPSATAVIMSLIAEELSKENEITVICGPIQNEDLDYYKKIGFPGDKLKIIRAFGSQLSKNHLFKRIIKQFLITISLTRAMLLSLDANTKILAVTNPPLLPVILAFISIFRKPRSTCLLVHDLFPDNAFKMHIIRERSILGVVLKKLFVWSYRKVDQIIVIGRDMQDIVEKMVQGGYTEVACIPNWSDPLLINSNYPKEAIHDTKITFGYAGNMGRAQGLQDFASIIKCTKRKDIQFLFSGGGALLGRLQEELKNTNNIQFSENFFRHAQDKFYDKIDIAIVLLGDGMYGLGVPSKTYNLIAVGLPILFVGPKESEIYRLVVEEEIGWAFDWSEKQNLITFLDSLSVMDRTVLTDISRKTKLVAERYTPDIILREYRALINAKNFDAQDEAY